MGEPVNYKKLPLPLKLKHCEELVDRLYGSVGEALRKGGFIGRSLKGEKALTVHCADNMGQVLLHTWEAVTSERNDLYRQFYEKLGEKEQSEDSLPQDSGPDMGF